MSKIDSAPFSYEGLKDVIHEKARLQPRSCASEGSGVHKNQAA